MINKKDGTVYNENFYFHYISYVSELTPTSEELSKIVLLQPSQAIYLIKP